MTEDSQRECLERGQPASGDLQSVREGRVGPREERGSLDPAFGGLGPTTSLSRWRATLAMIYFGTFSLPMPGSVGSADTLGGQGAREAEANLCERRASGPPAAPASTAEAVRACPPSLRKSLYFSSPRGPRWVRPSAGSNGAARSSKRSGPPVAATGGFLEVVYE